MSPQTVASMWQSLEESSMLDRRKIVKGLMGASLILAGPARAHHGWSWAEDGNFELSGVITSAKLGNPHGILKVRSNGEEWTVEVGQPWRNARAGLKDAMLVKEIGRASCR